MVKNDTIVILVRGIEIDPVVIDNPNLSDRSYIIDDGRNLLFK